MTDVRQLWLPEKERDLLRLTPFSINYFGLSDTGIRLYCLFWSRTGAWSKAPPDFEGDMAGRTGKFQDKNYDEGKKQKHCDSQEEQDQNKLGQGNKDRGHVINDTTKCASPLLVSQAYDFGI